MLSGANQQEDALGVWTPIETIQQGSSFKRRIVLTPSIHLVETRTVDGEVIDGAHLRESNAQWQRLGPMRFAHQSRHVCPHTTTPPPFVIPTRDDPPDQPHFFATQQQDWDFWVKHRDLVFQGKGIHPADPMWDRVHALAEDIWQFRFTIQKPGGNDFSRECPWSSPTATLIYGSWCAGCGPALIALCATIGAPARAVQVLDHMMVEVWMDGQWCLVDNVTSFASDGGAMMLHATLADVLLDPTNPQWGFIPAQQGKYWEKTLGMYSSHTGLYHEEPWITFLTPGNALALYPGWAHPRFKSHQARSYDLLWGRPQLGDPFLILKQGQALRRRFWLGSLDETECITAYFYGERTGGAGYLHHHVPSDGGQWFMAVNDHRFPVRELGGWQFSPMGEADQSWLCDCAWSHRFELPLSCLREHDWNTIAIGSTGSGAEFLRFGGYADWILPEEHCLCQQVQEYRF